MVAFESSGASHRMTMVLGVVPVDWIVLTRSVAYRKLKREK